MITDITLGQYFPAKSILHKADPRIKLSLSFLMIIFTFVANTYLSIGLMVATVFIGIALSKVPLKMYFRGLKPIFVIVILTSVLNIFYYSEGNILWHWKFITITDMGIIRSILIAIRIACMILYSCILTYTTSPTDLTDAIERLMKPLKYIKVPVHEIAMMMTIALRFVPTLLEETDKIMAAQKARGADLESGGLMQRLKALIPILIPLFVSSFRRAFELAVAMECRCYHGGEGRTRMKQLHLNKTDITILVVTLIICTGVIVCNILTPTVI